MGKATTPVSLISCLLLCTLPGPLLSQTQEPQSAEEALRQQSQQRQQEYRQRVDEQREQMIRRQEEFNQRVEKQERQRLQELWPSLSEEERQRQEEAQRRKEEQRRQSIQRQREFWQQDKQREKERQQQMEEWRRKEAQRQKAIRKVADEYSDEVWQEALGATPEQWKAIKPWLDKIHQLKDPPYVDVSIYWIAGSTSYQAQSLVESPDGTYSRAKAFGWFSVTTGAGSTSENSSGSGGSGRSGALKSAEYSATTRTATAPEDSNRPDISVEARRVRSGPGRAVADGAIKFGMRIPGPVKKQVDDIALGWQWERPALDRSPDTLSESEKVCERLVEALEVKNLDLEQIRRQVEVLRQVRQQRQAELRETQRQLSEIVTPEQEAKLISMGYLE